ncbi:MAG: hypothetical protein H7Y20_08725 [Bryobacteraceae bacterium]|nr:hypothetical protein [Bryobacteraceae bacterium]
MLLLTGPPASGKTSFCLGELRECLRKNRSDCRLLLPTTTMAEHLRNELAREGLVFPPRMVSTFGKFVSDYSKDLCAVSSSSLEMIVEEQLARLPDGRYSRVREFPGFRSAVMRAIEEFSGAGGTEIHLSATDPEFAAVSKATNAELALRKQYSRAARLRRAAEEIGRQAVPGKIWISGFFGFTPPELDVLLALDKRCDLTVTLADSAATAAALASLRMVAPSERRLESNRTEPDRVLVTASTADAEANEIARRILELRNKGRAFREIGIIVRSENPSVPALRDGFERFGIPYRSYFAQPLRADATVRYLLGLVDAALSGWEFDRSLPVLRMHGSPLEVHGDQFEYEVFRSMPGRLRSPESARRKCSR